MKSFLTLILSLTSIFQVSAFVVRHTAHVATPLAMMLDASPATISTPPQATNVIHNSKIITSSNYRPASFNDYLSSPLESSSTAISLEERKPPTAAEIASKKRNFNFWFWGGGIIAPFIATVYYFGLRFWER
eukprot:CAMPEP_0198248744 /NCGR_PEP_ID=MMETSP1447-20131203/457_1 /TAXON_ID=420782 /ORGANISM="Chaetoceros dichaeta, Strain CCMP1751" /LENGTH=131 /DNA_ID=CAMNT_0043933223 /DNA_START=83 /DNA_END=478 /DNA_ORIENTATION=-